VEVVNTWVYFVLGMIAWQVIKMLALAINREVIEHRQRRFLKLISIKFKDERENVTFVALDTSDKRAMKRLEQQLRTEFDLPEEKR
jgi:hypothetical protein